MIKKLAEITADRIPWDKVGERLKELRAVKKLSPEQAGKELGFPAATLIAIERGTPRKSTNFIWHVIHRWDISLNWLLNGVGSPQDPDPTNLLPQTLIIDRGCGIARSQDRSEAEEGQFSDEVLEFVMAIDKFKITNQVSFPTYTQIYEIAHALGYRKTARARIAPLGHTITRSKT